jgi:hypothetical protein
VGALEAVVADERTGEELDSALEGLMARIPNELSDAAGPLGWVADRAAARVRLIELGLARLATDLGIDAPGSGD